MRRRTVRGASVAALRNNHACHTASRGEAWHARAATTREGSRVVAARHVQNPIALACSGRMGRAVLSIEDAKTGEPLEFPVTRQFAAILERRLAERESFPEATRGWVFPSEISGSGHLEGMQYLNARIGEAKFSFHALRSCFITVADRELMLPASLTKRLVNHARPQDVTEGYAADWTMEQLRDAAQRIAGRIDEFICAAGLSPLPAQ